MSSVDVCIVGGGMITHDLFLPSLYHLQRTGVVGGISVCALDNPPLRALKESRELQEAFPGQDFDVHPPLDESPNKKFPDSFKEIIASMPSRQVVLAAVPDQLHYPVVMHALHNNQHVLCARPFVLKHEQAVDIEKTACAKGLFVGVEYCKRFAGRALAARKDYRLGKCGVFAMGEAKMVRPFSCRFSNYRNWFSSEQTDPFVNAGSDYVDLVWFITGLKPVEVSVCGVTSRFPDGGEGYIWANGRVRYENGSLLSVTGGFGCPDDSLCGNAQGMHMFCERSSGSTLIAYDDRFGGLGHGLSDTAGGEARHGCRVNPDICCLVPWEGPGYKPVGHGFESVAATVKAIAAIEDETSEMREDEALESRRAMIKAADEKGLIATPANSYVNQLVVEAARLSILNDGDTVRILYGDAPHITLRNKA